MVTTVALDEIAAYVESAALVTVTVHVPALVADNVELLIEHPAVPADVTA
jgi:hypothetical protein